MVARPRPRNISELPARDPGAYAQLGVVGLREKILVEASNPFQHRTPVHGGASVRPEDFFDAVVLTRVQFSTSPPAVLAIRINQVADFIDALRTLIYEDLRRSHPHTRTAFKSARQSGQPIRRRLGVIIQ